MIRCVALVMKELGAVGNVFLCVQKCIRTDGAPWSEPDIFHTHFKSSAVERGKKVTVFDNFTCKKSPGVVIETGSALPDAPILTSPKLPNNRCGQTYS